MREVFTSPPNCDFGKGPCLCGFVSLRLCVKAAASFVLAVTLTIQGQEWTRFRGPNGTGISETKGIPTKIGEANLDWKVELPGSGHCSPVAWGEHIFVTCTGDKSGGISVLCLNAKDGKVEW